MKFWQSISWAEAGQLTDIARYAEERGFYGVINSEHLFLTKRTKSPYPYTEDGKMNHALDYAYPDMWSSFAAMAAVTEKLRFSSSVYLLPLRNPIEVAKQAATCALISNNRVTIGFGVGWQKEEFDAMGVDFHTRGKRTDEMIEVMRKLWAAEGGAVSHQGRFFEFDEIEMRPVPTDPIPFYCGGKSPAALKRAATLCQGYMGPGHSMNEVPGLIAELNRLRADSDLAGEPFETIVPVLPPNPVADTYKRLEDMGVTATFLPPFDTGGLDRGHSQGLGRGSSLDAKQRIMDHYAETILRHFN